jgi:cystathionine beta-synthase
LPYLIEGVGQERIPGNLDIDLIDEIVNINDKEAFTIARRLAREEGIFCGGSSGMNVAAALKIGKNLTEKDIVVAIICDTGERYLTKHHSDEWLKEKNLLNEDKMSVKTALSVKSNQRLLAHLLSISPDDTVEQALQLMQENEISELPVFDNGKPIGTVRDNKLMSKVIADRSFLAKQISEIMEIPMPIIDSHADIQTAIIALKDNHAVLVSDFGKITGILTRHDILEFI